MAFLNYFYFCSVSLLPRIHHIPSVPVVDLFQKIRQQVKCYLMTASVMEPNDLQEVSDTVAYQLDQFLILLFMVTQLQFGPFFVLQRKIVQDFHLTLL